MNRNLLRVMRATINSVTSDECNEDIAVTETEMEDTYKKIVDKLAHSIFSLLSTMRCFWRHLISFLGWRRS